VVWTNDTAILVNKGKNSNKAMMEPGKEYEPDCIDRRYANYLEFQFWGYFSWYEKGPYHI